MGEPRTGEEGARDRVMIVDCDAEIRPVELTIAGIPAWTTRDRDEAVHLVHGDPSIRAALIDYDLGFAASLVGILRAARPEILIVGTSASDRWEEFRDLGVDRFLIKPWEPRAFVAAVSSRNAT